MKYNFETVHGRSFTVDCDEGERIQSIVQRAALSRGYDPKCTELSHRGTFLDPVSTLSDNNVDFRKDILIVHGTKTSKKRPLTLAEEGECLEEAENDRKRERGSMISLESIRDNMQAKKVELEKPTFLSKEQRAQRALEKREAAAREQQEKLKSLEATRSALLEGARQAGRDVERQAKEQRKIERSVAEADNQRTQEEQLKMKELDQIKAKYVGQKKQKKVIKKHGDRLLGKKIFEWDVGDDTTDVSFATVPEPNILYGRGFKAGIDARDQLEGKVDYEQAVENRETEIVMENLAKENTRKEQRIQLKQMLKKDKANK